MPQSPLKKLCIRYLLYQASCNFNNEKFHTFKPMHMKQKFNSLLRCCLCAGVLLIFTQLACSPAKQSSGTASNEEIAQAIATDNWIFIADRALPPRGRSRNLTGHYEVRFSKDTITAYLPYFGRAYSAPIGETTSPLDFKTTDFSISKEQNDKGRWNITIKPKDYKEVQSFDFTLYENGSAQLNVQLANRSPISFSGFVRLGK